jgi:hypothetical protein
VEGTPPEPASAPTPTGPGRDRWAWRRRLRANPRTRHLYRGVVGAVGGTLVVLSVLTGWLPGPGGIPLFLAGMAVLASEFAWARRLLDRARDRVRAFTTWAGRRPRWQRVAGTAGTAAAVVGAGYLSLVVLGAPEVLPSSWEATLVRLPGVPD